MYLSLQENRIYSCFNRFAAINVKFTRLVLLLYNIIYNQAFIVISIVNKSVQFIDVKYY